MFYLYEEDHFSLFKMLTVLCFMARFIKMLLEK